MNIAFNLFFGGGLEIFLPTSLFIVFLAQWYMGVSWTKLDDPSNLVSLFTFMVSTSYLGSFLSYCFVFSKSNILLCCFPTRLPAFSGWKGCSLPHVPSSTDTQIGKPGQLPTSYPAPFFEMEYLFLARHSADQNKYALPSFPGNEV